MNCCCKFCGQVSAICEADAYENESEAIEAATMLCDCPKAVRYQRLKESIDAAKQKVDEIISTVDKNHNISGLNGEAISVFKSTLDLFETETLNSIKFTFSDEIGILLAEMTSSGEIAIIRQLSIKKKV